MIAEPWDIGPGGYQLGNFPWRWQEWNDRFRDDVRRFWRGDANSLGALATRLAGSADIFHGAHGTGRKPSASINFLAAHDGFTLNDTVSFAGKRNDANGEENRDGHNENFSWNNGVEGPTDDPAIDAARRRDLCALLATLFVARGTPMLTAGDELRRTQNGNNNAYAQDNATTWLDWENADTELAAFTARLSRLRKRHPSLSADRFLVGKPASDGNMPDVVWLHPAGREMSDLDWGGENRTLGMQLFASSDRTLTWLNGAARQVDAWVPPARDKFSWILLIDSSDFDHPPRIVVPGEQFALPPRSVRIYAEQPRD